MMDDSTEQNSSQELLLSQETFTYLWTQLRNDGAKTVVDITVDDVTSSNGLIENDYSNRKVEDGISKSGEERVEHNNIGVPSSSAPSQYTQLIVSSRPEVPYSHPVNPEYTSVEFYSEDPTVSVGNRNHIPPTTDWPGTYDFQITFQPQEKTAKSTNWIYSEIKKKLYVNMAVACPVNVHTKTQPPAGTVIRAMCIFSMPEHITDPVKRCLNHSSPSDPTNDGHPAPDHLIRCDNPTSRHVEDCNTKRHSVITDYEAPEVGMEYTTYIYRFMCLGSCVGGLNRRPLQLIFTLEKDGQCLGRKLVCLRICACPGRDKRTDEKQLEKSNASKRSNNYSNTMDMAPRPPVKRQKTSSGDEESVYTVTVYRRSHYEILKKIADALELADLASLLTPEESAALQQRYIKCRQKKQQSRESQQSSEESST